MGCSLSTIVLHFYLLSFLSLTEILVIKNEEFCSMNNLEEILFTHGLQGESLALLSSLCPPVTTDGFVFPNADLKISQARKDLAEPIIN